MNALRPFARAEAARRNAAPESPIRARGLAQRAGMIPPVSLRALFESVADEERSFHAVVVTPAGTALGGTIDMTLRSNGTYTVGFHMHDSGIPDYDFLVRAIFTTPGGLVLAAQHGGHVEGTASTTLTHAPNRNNDHRENGSNPMIKANWEDIKAGRLWATKDYSPTGVVGFFQDLAQSVLDIAAPAVGAALGVVVALGSEVSQLFGDLGLGGTFGVIAGIVVFAATGSVVLAVVAGVAVGAVTEALVKQRPLSAAEAQFAARVFGGSLPSADRIILTNLAGLGGRAFTMPGGGGKIYLNLGDAYDDPVNHTSQSYPTRGQVLIHELTHAWQIRHSRFIPGTVCAGIVNQVHNTAGQSVYVYGPPGPAWSSGFNLEQQGAVVDQWFAGVPNVNVPNRNSMMDTNDPYYRYIRDNILPGRP